MDFYNSTVRDWIKHIPKRFGVYVVDEEGWSNGITFENVDYIPGIDLVPNRIEFNIILRTVTFFVSDVRDSGDSESKRGL